MTQVSSGYRPYAKPWGAIAIEARENVLDCPKCGLRWTPTRVKRRVEPSPSAKAAGARIHFEPLQLVRCIGCKSTFERPIAEEGIA